MGPSALALASAAFIGGGALVHVEPPQLSPADVAAGVPTSYVLVKTRPGVSVSRSDGLPTFRRADRGAAGAERTAPLTPSERACDGILAAAGAQEITRAVYAIDTDRHPAARAIGLDRHHLVRVPEGTDVWSLAEALRARTDLFESAEVDCVGGVLGTSVVPIDPLFTQQWSLNNTGQVVNGQAGTPNADVNAPEAWAYVSSLVPNVLAIVDSGVSQSHPDLVPHLVPGFNATSADTTATDDDPFVPHGTAAAGIAAAFSNNGSGITGLSWTTRIMPIKVTALGGFGTELMCANGLTWAASNGADVASMSLGYSQGTTVLRDSVLFAAAQGLVLVASTGNTPGATVAYPARWSSVIAVGATDNRDQLWSNSTTGTQIDVVAPGVNILTTTDSAENPDGYALETGTSFAAPHVSGLASLILAANPSLTAAQVRAYIETTCKDLGPPGWDSSYGHGRIDAGAALLQAAYRPGKNPGDPAGGNLPCPADFNRDGSVDALDFNFFIDLFSARDPRADLNNDGEYDALDFNAFVELINGGCNGGR